MRQDGSVLGLTKRQPGTNAGADVPARPDLATRIVRDTDTCVACGMCLSVCPTYRQHRMEAESPRGRIALARALAEGWLADSANLERHLDHCLNCLACERICPANVRYGRIIDAAHALVEEGSAHGAAAGARRWDRWMAWLMRGRRRLSVAGRLLAFYQGSGLQRLSRATPVLSWFGLARSDRMLPPVSWRQGWKPWYRAPGTERARVALFTGCMANVVDRPTLEAGIRVLNRLGVSVHVPAAQTCCGAIDLHGGRRHEFRQSAFRNVDAFAPLPVDAVLTMASGCGAVLARYGDAEDLDEEAREAWRAGPAVLDISEYLSGLEWPESAVPSPLPRRVALHTPCTLENVLRRADAPGRLLRRIPGIMLTDKDQGAGCCGAAGTHMFTDPDTAEHLRDAALAGLASEQAEIIATSNIGCALHLAAGLKARGRPVEVVHPVVLLDRAFSAGAREQRRNE
jgi:glycolate oxidase iron-sulfur subunit